VFCSVTDEICIHEIVGLFYWIVSGWCQESKVGGATWSKGTGGKGNWCPWI